MVKFAVIQLVNNVVYNSSHNKMLKAGLYINECYIVGVGNDLQIAPKCLNWSYLSGYCYSIYHITGEHPGQFSYLWCQVAKLLLKYRGARI